jgi:hypothetical protein
VELVADAESESESERGTELSEFTSVVVALGIVESESILLAQGRERGLEAVSSWAQWCGKGVFCCCVFGTIESDFPVLELVLNRFEDIVGEWRTNFPNISGYRQKNWFVESFQRIRVTYIIYIFKNYIFFYQYY